MSVLVEEDVAVSKCDERDTVPERGLRGEVSDMASVVVIMRQHEHVDQPEASEVEPRLGA